jgi:hypothetical protein
VASRFTPSSKYNTLRMRAGGVGVSGNGRHGRRGRRLMLAPATMRALRPSSPLAVADEDAYDEDDRRRAEGRAALSRAVSPTVEAS